jgi:hypothetical protein
MSQTPAARRALDTWFAAWIARTNIPGLEEMYESPSAEDWWKRIGFARHAHEYWALAELILLSTESEAVCLTTTFDQDQQMGLKENLCNQLLSNYDESDMGQVHDLVTLFGDLDLK